MTINHTLAIAAGLAIGLAGTATPASAAPPAPSFTYQGSLNQNGSPVNGQRDMRFRLYNVETGGSPIQTVQVFDVELTNGLFAVEVNFGSSAWTSNDQFWVEIEAGPADQSQSYEVIGRQKLTGTPYALNTRGILVDDADRPTMRSPALRQANDPDASEGVWRAINSTGNGEFVLRKELNGSTVTTPVVILDNGDIGVGTLTPDAPLHIFAGESGAFPGFSNTQFVLESDAGNVLQLLAPPEARQGIYFGNWNGSGSQTDTLDDGAVIYDGSLNEMQFRVGGFSNPRMKITSDGRVGINLASGSSPAANLDVGGDGNIRGDLSIDDALTIRGGADIVEGFDSICETAFEPGTVLVIDPENPGMLMCAEGAYDKKVAGVVSGAGGVRPGIKLGQDGVLDGDIPVAMTGRVYVKCTAENGAIEPGDLLTTADLAGHAMKASDAGKSNGSVIGKAMGGLVSGEGLVLVLVNLQ